MAVHPKTKKDFALIIPGYEMSPGRREYKKIAQFFADREISSKVIKIRWKRKTPRNFNDYIKDFVRQAKPYNDRSLYVLGFSFGAMIALLAHKELKYKNLILCSLSPYFKQDRDNLKPAWAKWWDKNYKKVLDFDKSVKEVKAKTFILVGGKEDKSCLVRAKDAKKKITNSKIKLVKNAEHKLQQSQYLKEIEKVIKQY